MSLNINALWTVLVAVGKLTWKGGEVNVDYRSRPILIVESTVFFRKSCRFVDRLFGQQTVDCRTLCYNVK